MTEQMKPNFGALERHIIDVIKEEQIKLGYRSETIRLYYPMESINNLLGTSYTLEELSNVLNDLSESTKSTLGDIVHSNVNTRFCFTIPPEGVTYVHEKVEDKHFLREFIEKMSSHNTTLDEIMAIFHKYSDHVICEKMDNGEFDYLVYFQDENPDAYRYCLKFEVGHAIYHRFTLDDYLNFEF
jgi:hypothetical protein